MMSEQCIRRRNYSIHQSIRFPTVISFLQSKELKSWKTAFAYMHGLLRLQKFLEKNHSQYNIETLLRALEKKEADPYRILDEFVSFIMLDLKGGASTTRLSVAAVSSYWQYYDVDINSKKFKMKVTMPDIRKEDEKALDKSDVRRILSSTSNLRLRAYLHILACGGMRATEACAIRIRDIDFSCHPTKIYLRAEYSKNKLPREVYITDEATESVKKLLKKKGKICSSHDELIFTNWSENPNMIYYSMIRLFRQVLALIEMDKRKENMRLPRREITLHSFRRFVETTVEDNTSLSFADYILGHKKSVYYTKKEPERRALWNDKCHRPLTFLDYTALDAREKNIEAQLEQKDKEIQSMRRDLRLMACVVMAQDQEAKKKAYQQLMMNGLLDRAQEETSMQNDNSGSYVLDSNKIILHIETALQ